MEMQPTLHFKNRVRNRGIQRSMVDIAIEIGEIKGDKYVTNRKNLKDYLQEIDSKIYRFNNTYQKYRELNVAQFIEVEISRLYDLRSLILKMLKKGGITVVVCGENLITTYRTDSFKNKKKYAA